MNQRELKARIKNDPDLTGSEKAKNCGKLQHHIES